MIRVLAFLSLLALLPLVARAQDAGVAPAVPAGTPRYLPAMQRELDALGLENVCRAESPVLARCEYHARGPTTHEDFDVHITYSDETDTIYVFIAELAHAPAAAPQTPRVLRRLMELNWELLSAKMEWNAADGEVRVAMVLHTDSNFDRRAFRSVVRSVTVVADHVASEIRALAAGAAN